MRADAALLPVQLEHAVSHLVGGDFGDRGAPWDADRFRSGQADEIAAILEAIAAGIEARVGRVSFSSTELEPGGPRERLRSACRHLRTAAQRIRDEQQRDNLDHHWDVIHGLLLAVGGLLDHARVEKPLP